MTFFAIQKEETRKGEDTQQQQRSEASGTSGLGWGPLGDGDLDAVPGSHGEGQFFLDDLARLCDNIVVSEEDCDEGQDLVEGELLSDASAWAPAEREEVMRRSKRERRERCEYVCAM